MVKFYRGTERSVGLFIFHNAPNPTKFYYSFRISSVCYCCVFFFHRMFATAHEIQPNTDYVAHIHTREQSLGMNERSRTELPEKRNNGINR